MTPAAASHPRGRRAFTLVEVMVAASMTAVLLVAVLFGTISLQHGYTSTEEYSAGQADQSRLLDLLALDLRRGIQSGGSANCYVMDPDGQGLKITVPDLYSFGAGDPQHLCPLLASASFVQGWTTINAAGKAFTNYGHAFPATGSHAYTLATHLGEGNTTVQTRVYVDVPGSGTSPMSNFAIPPADAVASYLSQLDNPTLRDTDGVDRSNWWYRITSVGIAGLSGPARSGIDSRDGKMRRLSFFNDWRTGLTVPGPQTARLVQVLVKPFTGFRNALMADKWINLNDQNVLIDSYDSSKGIYSATTNHGSQGNLATNGRLINAGHAEVDGGASTNDGSVKDADKVTGQQSSNFYQELTPYTNGMLNPAWSSTPNGGTLVTDATFTASTDPGNPTRVHLKGIALPDGGHTIYLKAPPTPASAPGPAAPPGSPPGTTATTTSYLKVFIDGDMATNGTSAIEVDSGVNVIVYITGNVNLNGDGLVNDSQVASHVLINGIQPVANADGTLPDRSVTVATDQDFEGVIYAPNADVNLNMVAAVVAGGPASPPGPAAPKGGPAKPQPPTPPSAGPGHQPPAPPTPGQQTDHAAGYNGIYTDTLMPARRARSSVVSG